ncbi:MULTISPECIES: hypothetical protein [unclassified Methylobacterium]|uniref:hypothetical protein n=1 Tax=unclassified Methylobacterium TaxID=2615210 RepID=UPI00226A27CC|nr:MULTISPECIES: hypothetical protein [unclassified Methylobacterium]
MSVLIVHVELNRSDIKAHKSRLSIIVKEIEMGRRPGQISSNGSVFFLQTPEGAPDFAKRLIENCGMNSEKDRLAVIDVSQGKAYIWGIFDAELEAKFPFLVVKCDA